MVSRPLGARPVSIPGGRRPGPGRMKRRTNIWAALATSCQPLSTVEGCPLFGFSATSVKPDELGERDGLPRDLQPRQIRPGLRQPDGQLRSFGLEFFHPLSSRGLPRLEVFRQRHHGAHLHLATVGVRRHRPHVNQRLPSSAVPRKDPHPAWGVRRAAERRLVSGRGRGQLGGGSADIRHVAPGRRRRTRAGAARLRGFASVGPGSGPQRLRHRFLWRDHSLNRA